ncbi:MAG TPA: hypothetical protein VFI31_08015, partial [Pirellulales bacterium]|nr:hypothetical protein [Pirellulales bacterium]
LATTLIDVYRNDDVRVARWQFEVGDHDSPGCHFHASANQQEHGAGLFPTWLKIPRLPGLLFSPMDGLDFLLGELFQSEWEKAVGEDSQHRNGWAQSQRQRLDKLLSWQLKQVRANKVGTPWMSLKRAKPTAEIFSGK